VVNFVSLRVFTGTLAGNALRGIAPLDSREVDTKQPGMQVLTEAEILEIYFNDSTRDFIANILIFK
jgi:hypothetical protein